MKRKILIVFVTIMISTMLTGCGNKEAETAQQSTEVSTQVDEVVEEIEGTQKLDEVETAETIESDDSVSTKTDELTPPETIPEPTEEPSEKPKDEINQEVSEIEFNLVEEFYSIDTYLNFIYEGTEYYADTTVRDYEVGATKFEETTINGMKADLEQRVTKPGSWYVTVPYEADEATVKQIVEEVFDTNYKASDLWLEDSNVSSNMLKNVQAKLDESLGAIPLRITEDEIYIVVDTDEVPEYITKIKINFADLFHTANYPANPYSE